MQGRTFNTQLYIDSEQTIMNDLKDTFSCKSSNQSTSIFKINTSTYSVTRTANHISQRLNQASKRLQTIERSVSKSRNKGTTQSNKNSNVNDKIRAPQVIQPLRTQKQIQLSSIYINSQKNYIELISRLRNEIQLKSNHIQQLENKLSKKEKLLLTQQQKFLREQNALIIQINRLKDLLQQKSTNENKTFRQKVQMERIVDQHKVRLWELQQKVKNAENSRKNWQKKQKMLKLITKKHYQDIQREQMNKGLTKKAKNTKQLINSFINVLGLEPDLYDEDKENKHQYSNRNKNSQYNQLDEWEGNTYRSFTVQKGKKQVGLPIIRAERILEQQFSQEELVNQNEDLYYILALQASTIQKLSI